MYKVHFLSFPPAKRVPSLSFPAKTTNSWPQSQGQSWVFRSQSHFLSYENKQTLPANTYAESKGVEEAMDLSEDARAAHKRMFLKFFEQSVIALGLHFSCKFLYPHLEICSCIFLYVDYSFYFRSSAQIWRKTSTQWLTNRSAVWLSNSLISTITEKEPILLAGFP